MHTQEKIPEQIIMLCDELYIASEQKEEVRKVALISRNEIMIKLLASWEFVTKYYDLEQKGWDQCNYSQEEWCNLAFLPQRADVFKCQENLEHFGLIFPDGRIPTI